MKPWPRVNQRPNRGNETSWVLLRHSSVKRSNRILQEGNEATLQDVLEAEPCFGGAQAEGFSAYIRQRIFAVGA